MARPKMTTSQTVRITPPTAAAVRRSAFGPFPNHRRNRQRRAVWGASDDGADAKAERAGTAGDADPGPVDIPSSVAVGSYAVKRMRSPPATVAERGIRRRAALHQALDCRPNRTDDRFVRGRPARGKAGAVIRTPGERGDARAVAVRPCRRGVSRRPPAGAGATGGDGADPRVARPPSDAGAVVSRNQLALFPPGRSHRC